MKDVLSGIVVLLFILLDLAINIGWIVLVIAVLYYAWPFIIVLAIAMILWLNLGVKR